MVAFFSVESFCSSKEIVCLDEPNDKPKRSCKAEAVQKSLKFLEVNVCGLRSKKHKFITLIQNYDPDVFVAVETWISEEINESSLFPDGYSIFRRDRNSHGGGVLIGIKTYLSGQLVYLDKKFEFLVCKFQVSSRTCYVLGCYRPPDNEGGMFSALNRQFLNLKLGESTSTPILILGDFNLPSIRWDSGLVASPPIYGNAVNLTAVDFFSSYNLKQMVIGPTRKRNILDLVFVNSEQIVRNVSVEDGISDHKIVFAEIDLCSSKCEPKSLEILLYQKINKNGAVNFLETSFQSFYASSCSGSVDDLWNDFVQIVTHLVNTYIPKKSIFINTSRPSWFNGELRNLERRMKKAGKNRKSSATSLDKYKQLVNEFNTKKQAAEDFFISRLYETGKQNNFKQLWSYIRSERGSDREVPPLQDSEGNLVFSSKLKADLLNKHYSNVFVSSTQDVSDIIPVPLRDDLYSFSFSAKGIESWIRKMPYSTSINPDNFSIAVLKLFPDMFSLFLVKILEKSLFEKMKSTYQVPGKPPLSFQFSKREIGLWQRIIAQLV